ncbi:STAS domain-containing protein [Pseudomonas sp. HR96]|uniref:STAS domain-containing protein n=1 Tax=Pseudomonas sp. HR96 TaxID=1027966 RepID=UPI002A75FB53|nr:STAS domain-containing protein [Pseudomonas sp. HR96]WPO99210.1 STAS domain-containing protein [Pseudomonas sp. HR96]
MTDSPVNAALSETAPGQLMLGGVLDYRTGAALRKQGQALISGSQVEAVVVDCSAVEKSSSVGVSLLLAFTRDAIAAGKTLQVRAMPHDMQQIAQVCGLTGMFAEV